MQGGFEKCLRESRRDLVLGEIDKVVPWRGFVVLSTLSQGHKRSSSVGSGTDAAFAFSAAVDQPVGPGQEEVLCESVVLRHLAGINLGCERCLTRRRSATFATFLRSTILAGRWCRGSTIIRQLEAPRSRPEPLWMGRLFMHPVRARTSRANLAWRCARPRRATHSISA